MKPKPSLKRTKKSPVTAVLVERVAPPPAPPAAVPSTPPAAEELQKAAVGLQKEEPKEQRLEVARKIAEQLGETADEVRGQISLLVKKVGTEEATTICEQALAIEAQGGMMLPDGSRRRTVGGIFFLLTRQKHPKLFTWHKPKKKAVSVSPATDTAKNEGESSTPSRKATPAPPPVPLLMKWEERFTTLNELGTQKGTIMTAKLTLIGKPEKIVTRNTCIVTAMQAKPAPSLPKGLPTPPAEPTTYTVYIALKQWNKVAEALKDPEDVLIVEGFPQLDPQTSSIAVFATNVTTKKLQQAQRQAQQERGKSEEQGA